jgi:fluoroquinolone transport system permease protein
VTQLLALVRFDVIVQARNGFYWASGFVVLVVSALLAALPEAVTSAPSLWVPALAAFNLQITTFFFVAGLVLLEREEGTLTALGASPASPRIYMTARTMTLAGLAAVETLVIIWIGFGISTSWWLLTGIVAMGVTYTGFGAAMAMRYASVNELLLPASVIVTLLLLPLLGHFGLTSPVIWAWHPMAPAILLMRGAYGPIGIPEAILGGVGAAAWAAGAFRLATVSAERLMRDTRASGGR